MSPLQVVQEPEHERPITWAIVTAAIEDYLEATAPTDDQPDGHATTLTPGDAANWVLRRLDEAGYAIMPARPRE